MGIFDLFSGKKKGEKGSDSREINKPKGRISGYITTTKIDISLDNYDAICDVFIAFDTETTGLSAERDVIIEVGAVKFFRGEAVESYGSLIYEGRSVPAAASQVNHITTEMLKKQGRPPEVVYKELVGFLEDVLSGKICICAHNASFDMSFLKNTLERFGYSGNIRYIDTLSLSRKLIKDLPNHKQGTIAEYFKINRGNTHRAVSDATACGKILVNLLKLKEDDINEERIRYEKSIPTEEEKEVFAIIAKSMQSNGCNIHNLRTYRNSSNYVVLLDVYTIFRFKLAKKKSYVVVPQLYATGIDPIECCTKTEGTTNVRILFDDPFELERYGHLFSRIYSDIKQSQGEHMNQYEAEFLAQANLTGFTDAELQRYLKSAKEKHMVKSRSREQFSDVSNKEKVVETMAKFCPLCGKKLGIRDGKIAISDGMVCTSCWTSAGFDLGARSVLKARSKTTAQLRDLIQIETLKVEREKNKANQKNMPPKTESTPAQKKEMVPVEEAFKPVDIIIAVDKDNQVVFACEGQPVINFEDLVNQKEMIIGDGFIQNESKEDLPEVRIACEFEPAIVDPGLIYYEAGTFKAGDRGRFEIDDPPVNLEEYAKIKRTRNGKIKFTLFLGEQELSTVECSMKVKPAPADEIQELMNAIIYEQEKNASGPVNVFLYARDTGAYEIDLMRHPQLLYSMYSNGQEQLIGDVYVVNQTGKTLKNVQFEAEFTSDILSPMKVLLGDAPSGKNTAFEVDDPAIDVDKLEMLTEVETCIATYRLLVNGKLVAESTGKIEICPFNQWNAALILLPAYITPNHPNVITLLQKASKWMLVNGMNPSLEGYQGDAKRVEEMINGVYNAVKEANIIYSNPPASFFGPQRIRLAESVFKQKFATCMDMTILFASCLESFGLHPVLITAPGHIFAGVWLNNRARLQEPVLSDAKLIQKYIEDGELVAVECTAMTVGKDKSYEEAKKIAFETIKALAEHNISEHECIDVQMLREIGIRPLPMRVSRTTAAPVTEPNEPIMPANTKATNLEQPSEKQEPVTDQKQVKVQTTYVKEDYVEFEESLSHISADNFYDKETKKDLKDAIVNIVAIEGPISQPALIKILIKKTSLGHASKQISEHLDKLVAAANVKITRQSGVRFLWNYGTNPDEYMVYRMKAQRNPEDICKYELKNAVCYLIQENGPMTKEEIMKAMVSMFGYSRSSKKIEDGANDAIKAARGQNAIELGEDKKYRCIISGE